MTDRQKRTLLLVPALLLAVLVVPMALAWSELPDSMATHWGLDGTPNGHMPPTVLLLFLAGLFVAIWMAVAHAARRMPFDARSFIAGLIGVGGLLATVMVITVEANRGASDWVDAGEFNGVHIILVFAVAIALGALGWWLAGQPVESTTARAAEPGPRADIEPGVSAVWSGRGRGVVLVVIGLVLLGVAIALWSAVSLFLVILTLPVLAFSEVRATAGSRGVVVSLGYLGIPTWLVPLETITGAEVEDVRPLAYGGWGYRVRPGARAVVVRGGLSLRLRRIDRPDLVLTVDDAEAGAGVVNSLIARR